MRTNPETRRLLEIAEPVCLDSGYELVELRLRRDQRGSVLQIFIDRAPGAKAEPIGFKDCENVSRELGAVLDVEDAIEHQYILEVSSPGFARPLRTTEHFSRYVGSEAKLTLDVGVDGRRRFKGKLLSVASEGDDTFIHVDVDGTEYALPLDDIDSAQLVPDWDALLGKAAGARS